MTFEGGLITERKDGWACGEIGEKVADSWRGVYKKEVEEQVDRRMKQGKPGGK